MLCLLTSNNLLLLFTKMEFHVIMQNLIKASTIAPWNYRINSLVGCQEMLIWFSTGIEFLGEVENILWILFWDILLSNCKPDQFIVQGNQIC